MKKSKFLSVLLALTTVMSTTAMLTPMSANAETETKTVEIFEDDFSGTTLNSAWERSGRWGEANWWRLKDGVLYDYEEGTNWCVAARAIDTASLPDVYDLNIEYKVQADDVVSGSTFFITALGTRVPDGDTNKFNGDGMVATISINGDRNWNDLTGIHYTTSGAGIELYGADDGYDDSEWYTIGIVAHIDGENNATFDYQVYNSDKTELLAEVENVTTKTYAGTVVEPTYLSFYKRGAAEASSISIDDVKVWATYEEDAPGEEIPEVSLPEITAPAGYKLEMLMEDDFTSLNPEWERRGRWGEANWFKINEGTLYDFEDGLNWTTASREFDVSNLPDEYDLNVRFKIKGKGANAGGNEFFAGLGMQPADIGNFSAGLNAATLCLNGDKYCNNVTGFRASTNGNSTPVYDVANGYADETWYTVVISTHINGATDAVFNYKIYDAAGTTLLASLDGVSTSGHAGSVVEPTYITFTKRNSNGFETYVAIDDLSVYAFYEDIPENVRKQTILADSFSGTALNSTWEVSGWWTNALNKWRLSDGALYDYESGANWTVASHALDVSKLPDQYDLHITYKAKVTDPAVGGCEFITALGTQAAPPNGNYEAGKNAVTISFNGSKFQEALSGIYYTTDGAGTPLYTPSEGYDDSEWYNIEIVAHIDGENNATYDYYVYDADMTMLLAEVEGVSTKVNYAGSVKEPTYLSFFKRNKNGYETSAQIDNLNVYAMWEITPVAVESANAVAFSGAVNTLSGELVNDFNQFKVTFEEALKEEPVIKLNGEDLSFTNEGREYTANLSGLLSKGAYTLTVEYAGETTTYNFTVKEAEDIVVSGFAWYNGDTEVKNFADLASGANALTLKVKVYNTTGSEKDLILGYATYKSKYMKAVNFAEGVKVASKAGEQEYTLPVTVNTNDADKVSGFVWENLTGLKPLADAAILD